MAKYGRAIHGCCLEDSETLTRLQVLLALGLTLRLGGWVEVWALADADATLAGTETVVVVVIGSGVEGGAVVPDSWFAD